MIKHSRLCYFINAQTQTMSPSQRGNRGKTGFWEQLDSIFKASTWTFGYKVTLTWLGAAVGLRLRAFNAANAFCWLGTNISDQNKPESYLCCTQKLPLASTLQLIRRSVRAEIRELRQGTFVDTAWREAVMNGSHPGEAPSCSLRLTRRGGTKRRESGEAR